MSSGSQPIHTLSLEEKRELLAQLLQKKTRQPKVFPLSFAQQRLWFLCQMVPDSPFYNIPVALRLTNVLDPQVLAQCFHEIVRRHGALRTTFATVAGEPVQQVHASLPPMIEHIDLRSRPADAREAIAQRLITEEAQRPFDLTRGSLLRSALLDLDDTQQILLLVMHHIVADGWSLGVLLRELAVLYPAFAKGQPSPLEDLPIQYSDFAVWQRDWLKGPRLTELIDYWTQQLSALPALLLPMDRPRPPVASFRGARQFVSYPGSLVTALNTLAQQEGCTLFMTLLAGFFTLLYRYSGQEDVAIGVPIANRTRAELEGLIGFFVNTLVLRGDLTGDPPFRVLLRRVRELTLDAYAHQDLPFEKLVEELQPDRDLGRNPLVQVLFALQNAPLDTQALTNQNVESLEIERGTANFDLVVDFWESPDGLGARFEYSTDLFDADTISRLAAQFETLLKSIVADPDGRLSELVLLPEVERLRLLSWKGTAATYPAATPLARLFEAQAQQSPDAPAVVSGDEQLTYRELDERANQLAQHLLTFGVQPETLIAVYMERSPALIVALLGILKAGGAYVPLDLAYPAARLAFILEETGSPVVISQQSLRKQLPPLNGTVVFLDTDWPRISQQAAVPPAVMMSTENLAYVMYTSGSTGNPKGIGIPQRAVSRLILGTDYIKLGPEDRIAQASNVAFDAATFEIWGALLTGACLVIVDRESTLAPAVFASFVREQKINTLFLTTALFNQIASTVPSAFAPLRQLLVGGEALDPGSVREVLSHEPPKRLLNCYGPTENTTYSTWHLVTKVPAGASTVPIGRPISNTEVYVLDERQHLAPIGVPGELYLGGAGLARGYFKRPALTSERFLPHPFADPPQSSDETPTRLYRTGDLVRWRADGSLEFLRRIDTQVKVRGFRVELGEIEAVLCEHPAVREAIVTAREDQTGQRLVAYLTLNPDDQAPDGSQEAERIAEWQQVYDEVIYDDIITPVSSDHTLNLVGWESSYSGQPIPTVEMREQVEQTVARVLAGRPRKVLEIGCGTGLLLFRIAPHCERYWGTDFSTVALDYVQRQLAVHPLPQVTLLRCPADDFSGIPTGSLDAVILNSVVQYFPNIEYLVRVVEEAIRVVSPGGCIFLGDVRSLPLLEALYTAIELHRAPNELPVSQLQQRIQKRLEQEEELVVDPGFFLALKAHYTQIGGVQILPKRGHAHNELTQFRYDVLLWIGEPASPVYEWSDWTKEYGSVVALKQALQETAPKELALRGVPNARVAAAVRTVELLKHPEGLETVAELRTAAEAAQGVDPEDVWAIADELPYSVELTWDSSSADGCYDVLLRHRLATTPPLPLGVCQSMSGKPKPWQLYSNNPLAGRWFRRLLQQLPTYLQQRLPAYMVPTAFVPLSAMPLTPNGKIDRQALPAPDLSSVTGDRYVAPRNPVEEVLATLWADVLGAERIGINDDFFQLGGHSLLVTQLVARIRDAFHLEVPLRRIFESPTVAELAVTLLAESVTLTKVAQGHRLESDKTGNQLVPRQRQEGPASFSQQRLWYLEQLFPGSPAYHIPTVLRLPSALNAEVLGRCLHEVARRHAVLRTTFAYIDEHLIQRIAPYPHVPLDIRDLRQLPEAERESAAQRLTTEIARQPFDLAQGPLLRAALLQLSDTEQLLLLVIHHIAADGWSLGLLFRELNELYPALASGQPSPLPDLPIQYIDFAIWQRGWLQGERLEQLLTYWKSQLTGVPPLLLPTDRPRPTISSFRGAQRQHALPGPLSAALLALGHREGSTLFMTLLAAFATLLHRYTGQEDFAIGSPIANRTRAEMENLIGFFLNTLALRIDLTGDPSFRTLLQRVRETALEAYTYQELPFEMLLEELHPERDFSRTPLFQVFFNLLNFTDTSVATPVLNADGSVLGEVRAQFDLAFYAGEVDGRIKLQLVYSTDLFDEATIERLLAHFETLLTDIVADPERHLSRLALMSDDERGRLAVARRDASPTQPFVTWARETLSQSISARFSEQVRRDPRGPAIWTSNGTWSYGELEAVAVRVAWSLRRHAGEPQRVALLFDHGAPMLAAILGSLLAGMTYVPLDTAYPQERLQTILMDAQVGIILTERSLRSRADELTGPVRRLLELESLPEDAGTLDELPPVPPDALAYILYTSGSSGEPKGVMQTHRNVLHHIRAYTNSLRISSNDGLTLLASYSFDAAVMDIFGALLNGATLYPIDLRHSGFTGLAEILQTQQITIVHATPTVFRSFLEAVPQKQDFSNVRLVVLGGEETLRHDVELFRQHFVPGCLLVNGLGPTESTLALQFFVDHTTVLTRSSVPVGYPVEDTLVMLLDDSGQPVDLYGVGEIVIRSNHVALGYWQRPEQTRAAFLPDPKGGDERCYHTGDLGRLLPDGSIEYVGRKDRQIKLRGQRVEPGEIEAQLFAHPAVAQAAVVPYETPNGQWGLAAYVALKPEEQPSSNPRQLLRFLQQRLPEPLVPTVIMLLQELPLTTTGKIDRRALLAHEPPILPQEVYTPPRTETEAKLAQIMAKLLGLEQVGIEDDFFHLGAHSLLAMQLVVRIRDAFNVTLPLRQVFMAPTVAGLAEVVVKAMTGSDDVCEAPIVPLPREAYRRSIP